MIKVRLTLTVYQSFLGRIY